MKAQCEKCKEIVQLDFVVEGAAIRVTCPSCRADYTVGQTLPRRPSLPAPPVPAVAEMTCPKCGDVQRMSDACRRCGLVIARWKPDAVAPDPDVGDAREAAQAWSAVENGWDEPERHEAFIALCRRAGVLAFAAARYRQAQGAGREGAAARLAQIRILAEQALAAVPRVEPPVKHARMRTVLLAAVVIILLALIALLVRSAFDVPRH